MSGRTWAVTAIAALLALGALACNEQRREDCEGLLAAMKPLETGTPTAEVVDSVGKQVDGLKLQDATLVIYAKNYRETLTVLSNTLKLKAGPAAPDGTDDVVNQTLKTAHTDATDAARYCAP